MAIKIESNLSDVFRVVPEDTETGGVNINIYRLSDNQLLGTPMRLFKSSGGNLIAADLPGVDPTYFIVVDGHVGNG